MDRSFFAMGRPALGDWSGPTGVTSCQWLALYHQAQKTRYRASTLFLENNAYGADPRRWE